MEVPVVATNGGGVAELVDDGIDGLLVNPKCAAELADALALIARGPELATRLGRAGRAKVTAQFRSSRGAKVLARYIRETIGPESATASSDRRGSYIPRGNGQ